MAAYEVHPTPNPNSLKFSTLGRSFIESGLESFSSAVDAQGHPLGKELFGVKGVANVLILPAFITVTKRPEEDWNQMLPKVEGVLDRHLAS